MPYFSSLLLLLPSLLFSILPRRSSFLLAPYSHPSPSLLLPILLSPLNVNLHPHVSPPLQSYLSILFILLLLLSCQSSLVAPPFSSLPTPSCSPLSLSPILYSHIAVNRLPPPSLLPSSLLALALSLLLPPVPFLPPDWIGHESIEFDTNSLIRTKDFMFFVDSTSLRIFSLCIG